MTKVLCGFVCFILGFLSQTVTILYRTAGKKKGYFLNSSVITEESLPLHTASSQIRTRAFMVSELTSKPTKPLKTKLWSHVKCGLVPVIYAS